MLRPYKYATILLNAQIVDWTADFLDVVGINFRGLAAFRAEYFLLPTAAHGRGSGKGFRAGLRLSLDQMGTRALYPAKDAAKEKGFQALA